MRPSQFLRPLLFITIASLSLTSCGRGGSATERNSARESSAAGPSPAEQNDARDTLHLFIEKSPLTLNPLLATTSVEQDLSYLAYDTLIAPDAANHPRPDLLSVVPTTANGGISRDGKTITFKLRHHVRWQDGRPFTSADVAFTFARINDPKVDVVQRSGFDRISRVQTPDPYTVIVSLREPFAAFVNYVGYQYPIVPQHLLEHSADFNRDPIGSHPLGTGPYRFVRWERGNRIVYTANETYFGGTPKIKHLSIAEIPDQNTVALEFRTHAIDMGYVESSVYVQLRTLPDIRTATEPTNDFVAYALKVTGPILRDVRVRRAFALAIDRAAITAKNTFGTGTLAYADLPAIMWMPHEPRNPYRYDPAAARTLLDAAGWKLTASGVREKNGVPLRLRNISYSGSVTGQNNDIQVAQMLRRVGIDWSTKYYSVSLYFESKEKGGPLAVGDFDTAYVTWLGGSDTENDQIYTCANREPIGSNFAFYCSSRMDALQSDSLTTLDPARRAADVVKIEELAATDLPYVFLYHLPWRLVWNPRLQRRHSNLTYPWYAIQDWSFTPP